jgi:hypothetical protein
MKQDNKVQNPNMLSVANSGVSKQPNKALEKKATLTTDKVRQVQ